MAVFVYSTGPIPISPNTIVDLMVNIQNRTTSDETFHIIVFDSNIEAPKTAIRNSGPSTLGANERDLFNTAIVATAIDGIEVEVRLSNPHMAPHILLRYTSPFGPITRDIYAGELFFDSTQTENP